MIKLFTFTTGIDDSAPDWNSSAPREKHDLLTTAETVAEAHKTLVEADSSNLEKFDQVIHFADQDVERLRKEGEKQP